MARLLVIEDNDANLELMRYLLQAYGHEVVAARDGMEGLALAEREPVDVIICDIHLPKMDGYEVARQLQADPRLSAIPRVAVTALAMVGDRDKVLAAGFDGYLAKPLDPQEFVPRVLSFLKSAPPSAAVPPRTQQPSAGGTEEAGGARILVVDDEPSNRALMQATLAPFGYRLTYANSVSQAIGLLRTESFDLILSDLHMPQDSGFDLLDVVRRDNGLQAVPMVLISSTSWGEPDRGRALAMGAARFLLRPIDPRVLLNEIATCLAENKEGRLGDDPGR